MSDKGFQGGWLLVSLSFNMVADRGEIMELVPKDRIFSLIYLSNVRLLTVLNTFLNAFFRWAIGNICLGLSVPNNALKRRNLRLRGLRISNAESRYR